MLRKKGLKALLPQFVLVYQYLTRFYVNFHFLELAQDFWQINKKYAATKYKPYSLPTATKIQ